MTTNNSQPLTPLELVELGNRITEKQAEDLEIRRLIEDARLVVNSVFKSVQSTLEPLGASEQQLGEVEKVLLGQTRTNLLSFASQRPNEEGQRPRNRRDYSIPEPLTVVDGVQEATDRQWKAVIVGRKVGSSDMEFMATSIMVLGHGPRDVVYKSWSRATQPVLGHTAPRYWDLDNTTKLDPTGTVI